MIRSFVDHCLSFTSSDPRCWHDQPPWGRNQFDPTGSDGPTTRADPAPDVRRAVPGRWCSWNAGSGSPFTRRKVRWPRRLP
jgi:hypothetical protein